MSHILNGCLKTESTGNINHTKLKIESKSLKSKNEMILWRLCFKMIIILIQVI